MEPWLDAYGRLFNPNPRVSVLPLAGERPCIVIDDVLANPDAVVAWAASQTFVSPAGNFYPGLVLDLPDAFAQRLVDVFTVHARGRLGGRRTLGATVRLAMVTTPPGKLDPCQWQCHRDRLGDAPESTLDVASVLYLFRDPSLGGTSFYRPLRQIRQIRHMIAESLQLDATSFGARYGVKPGYMMEGNAYFEHVARVPAAWNRMIFYDGGIFHSGDIGRPEALNADPRTGRLSMNSFITCRTNTR